MMAVSSTNQIGTENVSRSALRVANELRLQVTGDNVSVFSAIRAVLRKAILLNDADGTALDDMDKLDSAIKTDSAVSAQLGMTAKAKRKQEELEEQRRAEAMAEAEKEKAALARRKALAMARAHQERSSPAQPEGTGETDYSAVPRR